MSVKVSTAAVGAVCVGGSRPTEVMELEELMEVTAAQAEAEMLALLVLSVSVEAHRRRWQSWRCWLSVQWQRWRLPRRFDSHRCCCLCVGGNRSTEVMELEELMGMTAAEVDVKTLALLVLVEADRRRWQSWRCWLSVHWQRT